MERIYRQDRSRHAAALRLLLAVSVSISLHCAVALALPGPIFGGAEPTLRTRIMLPFAEALAMPSLTVLQGAPIPDPPPVRRRVRSGIASVESIDATYYAVDELDVLPVPLGSVQVADTPVNGYVRVLVRIDASGRVTDVRIFDSSAAHSEAHTAMLAVSRTLFAAARKNGRAVRSEVVIELAATLPLH